MMWSAVVPPHSYRGPALSKLRSQYCMERNRGRVHEGGTGAEKSTTVKEAGALM
jgi:hypothetical protein